MKFQKLTIHNIASIEDAVIDFEASPLAKSEVFLITGKTGAGKSTILDSICLALFATTPRMNNTNMQGDTPDGKASITIKDPRQLMRRNTGEAFVKLLFIGNNGVSYEAAWSVARARKKPSGTLQAKNWQLTNLDTLHTLTKDNEIKAEIKVAIGLDFNQFCRTTMLAQGEFTRFLNSKDDEKAEILEKITGVDVYSKIGAKVYSVANQKEQAWKNARSLVEGVTTLSAAEIEERKKMLESLDADQKALKETSGKEAEKRNWIKTGDDLSKKLNQATEAYREADKELTGDDYKKKELTAGQWNATIEPRAWLANISAACEEKKKLQDTAEKLSKEFALLLGGMNHDSLEAASLENQIKEIESNLNAGKSKESIYDNYQTIKALLDVISDGRVAVAQKQKEIAAEKKKLNEVLQPAHEKAKQQCDSARISAANEEKEVNSRQKEVETLNLSELRAKRDECRDLKGKISVAKERIANLAAAETKQKATADDLERRKGEIDKKLETRNSLESPLHDAQLILNIRKDELESQRDTVNKFARQLREKLTVGDICPVCRQKIKSELPHEGELESLVEGIQKRYDDAEKAYKELVESRMKLDADITAESRGYKRDLRLFDEDKTVAQAKLKAEEACRECGIEVLSESTLAALENMGKDNDDVLAKLNEDIRKGEKKESEEKTLRNILETKRKEFEDLTGKMEKARDAVAECNARIATAEALVNSKNSEMEDAANKASALLSGTEWDIDWEEKPKEFSNALAAAAKLYSDNKKTKDRLAGELAAARQNLENTRNVVAGILASMPQWEKVEPSASGKVDQLLLKANRLSASVVSMLQRIKAADDSITANREKLGGFLAENPGLQEERLKELSTLSAAHIREIAGALAKIKEEAVAKKSLMDNAQTQLDEHLKRKPSLAEDETLETLAERIGILERQLSEIGEKKGAINQQLKIDAENKRRLSALLKESDEKKYEYQKWSRINQLIGDATGAKFRKIAQSYVLQSLIHSANGYMKTLTDRYTLKITPGTFVISLEDAYQGYATRAASTISGGESFLVSLSLALALSDIGQTLSVDTLFIDEGFGTLSGEPLNNAINTLRTLHSKAGRQVGIISHVEELRERIPVQIQVSGEGNRSSSKITVVEN